MFNDILIIVLLGPLCGRPARPAQPTPPPPAAYRGTGNEWRPGQDRDKWQPGSEPWIDRANHAGLGSD
jgi:hypothetical protein